MHDVSASSDIGTAFPHELPELASPPDLASAPTQDPEEEPTESVPAGESSRRCRAIREPNLGRSAHGAGGPDRDRSRSRA